MELDVFFGSAFSTSSKEVNTKVNVLDIAKDIQPIKILSIKEGKICSQKDKRWVECTAMEVLFYED